MEPQLMRGAKPTPGPHALHKTNPHQVRDTKMSDSNAEGDMGENPGDVGYGDNFLSKYFILTLKAR